jgi:hypothetical protein
VYILAAFLSNSVHLIPFEIRLLKEEIIFKMQRSKYDWDWIRRKITHFNMMMKLKTDLPYIVNTHKHDGLINIEHFYNKNQKKTTS